MNIITKSVADLTPVEYKACYNANYGWDGYMMEELSNRRAKKCQEAIVIMIWDGPDNTVRSLKGWSLLTPTTTKGMLAVSRYMTKHSKYTVQFWVKKPYRRQGLGAALMLEAKKHDPRPHVIPHDTQSVELFSKFNVRSSSHDRPLKRKPKVA